MRALLEIRVSRRTAFKVGGAVVTLPLLSACEVSQAPQNRPVETSPAKEIQPNLGTGDVLSFSGKLITIVHGKKYEVGESYLKKSKFHEYGGKIKTVLPSLVEGIPAGNLSEKRDAVDIYTGGNKRIKKDGGEVNLWSGGFLTDSLDVYDVLKPEEDMFVAARKELKKKDFGEADEYFHTYGVKAIEEMKRLFEIGQYGAQNTAKSPEETFRQADEWVKEVLKVNPLVRLNGIGHSLGGVIMLNIARTYPGLFNNLILVASPVRGIDGEGLLNKAKMHAAKSAIRARLGDDEKVIDYFINMWRDEKYQKEIDDFSESFIKRGGKIHVIASSDDGVVPEQSTTLKSATHHVYAMGKNALDPLGLSGHGRPLADQRTIKIIVDALGENLAA